jgi:hypothetical protein
MVHETVSQKNPSQKRAAGVAQGVGPEFKSQYQYCKKKKKDLMDKHKTTVYNDISGFYLILIHPQLQH